LQTRTKVIFGAIVIFALLLFGLSQFLEGAQAGEWSDNNQAALTAYQKTIMVKATKVESFIGDQSFKIVYGDDALGQKLIAWISDSEIHSEYVSDGISDKTLRTQFAQKEPTASLMRILPGKLKNDYVWELFYKKPNEHGKQNYYYDYLNFKDGSLIDTYDLGVQ
jgi:uncharacterized protein YpmB